MVDDGGVFSPRIGRKDGLDRFNPDVSFPYSLPAGVGVLDLGDVFSGDLFSRSNPEARENRSGDLSGDLSGDRSSELSASV